MIFGDFTARGTEQEKQKTVEEMFTHSKSFRPMYALIRSPTFQFGQLNNQIVTGTQGVKNANTGLNMRQIKSGVQQHNFKSLNLIVSVTDFAFYLYKELREHDGFGLKSSEPVLQKLKKKKDPKNSV